LSHFSVIEYLTGKGISKSDVALYWVDEGKAHVLLANVCLTYLVFEDAENGLIIEEGSVAMINCLPESGADVHAKSLVNGW
jgi:hypothetical protein